MKAIECHHCRIPLAIEPLVKERQGLVFVRPLFLVLRATFHILSLASLGYFKP